MVTRAAWFLAVFGVILGLGLLVSRPSDGNGWFNDYLWHIRSYTGAELEAAWTGPWAPGTGTPGYRPLETLEAHLRAEILGEESPKKNRYVSVGLAALGLAVLAVALWFLGVPLYVGLGAAIIEFTARNFVFTYAWASGGYHAVQLLSFGLALLALAAALTRPRSRRTLLAASVALWAVTLLLKDQGLFLLPALVAVALAGQTPRRYAATHPDGALSYGRLWGVVRTAAKEQWGRLEFRSYVVAVVVVAVADVLARVVFVGGTPATGGSIDAWNSLVQQLGYVVILAGDGESAVLYWAFAAAVLLIALLAPTLAARRAGTSLATPWIVALFGALGLATSIAFAPARSAPYQVSFPLYFYALLVCATAVLVLRMLDTRRRGFQAAVAAMAALAAVSLISSIGSAADAQRAMGPWAIETLKYEYDFSYGPSAGEITIPTARRDAMIAHLQDIGLTGPRQAEPDDVLAYLYCRAQQDPRIQVPAEPAFAEGELFTNLDLVCPHIDDGIP